MIRTVLVFIALCASIVSASIAGALNIDIYGPGQSRVNLFIAEALSKDGAGALSAIPGNAPADLQQPAAQPNFVAVKNRRRPDERHLEPNRQTVAAPIVPRVV